MPKKMDSTRSVTLSEAELDQLIAVVTLRVNELGKQLPSAEVCSMPIYRALNRLLFAKYGFYLAYDYFKAPARIAAGIKTVVR